MRFHKEFGSILRCLPQCSFCFHFLLCHDNAGCMASMPLSLYLRSTYQEFCTIVEFYINCIENCFSYVSNNRGLFFHIKTVFVTLKLELLSFVDFKAFHPRSSRLLSNQPNKKQPNLHLFYVGIHFSLITIQLQNY